MAAPPQPRPDAILDTLNSAQSRAVRSPAATVAILAGPGSGKTHTLTSRVVYLVDHVGYRPQDVVVATFTVKAAREMQERIGRALGDARARKIVLGTFHSIARRYLAAYGQRIGLPPRFGIADDADARALVQRICKRLALPLDPPVVRAWISRKKARGTAPTAAAAPAAAAAAADPKGPHAQELQRCYDEYQSHLERAHLLDYDDLLVRCVQLLRACPSCVANVQAVLIDEYQDTNGVQYELMKLLAQARGRITVVGDPDQSIYGWRSAEIRNLWRLLRDFPGTDEVALEQNYRSSQAILDTALRVIQQDATRYQKALRPVHDRGARPVLRRLRDAAAEAEWIVCEIRRALALAGGMLTHGDVAVLLRSAALSRHVEQALGRAGIPYRMVGGCKFYERAEIRLLLDYLRVVHQPENNDALARIVNNPRRGVGDATVKALLDEAESASLSLWSLLEKHCRGDRRAKTRIAKPAELRIGGELLRLVRGLRSRADGGTSRGGGGGDRGRGLVGMIEHLLAQLRFQTFLAAQHPQDHEQRWAHVQEFVGLARDFEKELETRAGGDDDDALPEIEGLEQTTDSDRLARFLANVSLASDAQIDDRRAEGGRDVPLVTLSTIHAAKGLEWPVVFIPAAYDGSIPHARSDDWDEERRLLYVAMTRAQSLLYLSYPLYGAQGRQALSPFLSSLEKAFAPKGPCFDRPVMQAVARILQRELPAEESIYRSLPAMLALEDDLFPADPEDVPRETGQDGRAAAPYAAQHHQQPRAKRPRIGGPDRGGAGEDEPAWRKEYATTMEQASRFTVSALPGFVSAGAHQAALAAAAAPPPAAETNSAAHRGSRRPTNQASIVGFVKTAAGAGGQGPNPSTRQGAQPAIDPAWVHHKIRTAKMNPVPSPLSTAVSHGQDPLSVPSQSSNRPASQAPPRTDQGAEASAQPTQAAACLHATTCQMPKGLHGGIRRPAGLGRDGIAPLEKLRKPFRPLTIKKT